MSFIYNKIKKGPRTDPCETPELLEPNDEVKPTRTTFCFLFHK